MHYAFGFYTASVAELKAVTASRDIDAMLNRRKRELKIVSAMVLVLGLVCPTILFT